MQQNDSGNNTNLILAMALTMAILLGWSYFFDAPQPAVEETATQTTEQTALKANLPQLDSSKPSLAGGVPALADSGSVQLTDTGQRISIKTDKISGSIRLKGARIDDVVLTQYNAQADGAGGHVTLLAQDGTANAYFADFGWLGQRSGGGNLSGLPDANTIWTVEGNDTLTQTTPVTLVYTSPDKIRFERTIAIDENYLFTITDKVTNAGQTQSTIYSYGMISRNLPSDVSSFFILHEGPIGYLGDKLIEHKYADLEDKSETYTSTGGWAGLTDKYWLTALIPAPDQQIKTTYRYAVQNNAKRYYTDYVGPGLTLAPGAMATYVNNFYAGAKVLDLLDSYETKLGIKHFDLAVDFGWFYFLTKPIFHILTMAKEVLGNFGLAILLLTVILKLLFFPLANKSYRSMARMKQLQPKMAKLKEQYADDRMGMNQALMELYKKEKVNPMAGCLPMLIQIPVFFALYKVLFVSIEMRHAPFYGWIHDLSAPDPTSVFNLFGLLPYDVPSFLQIGAWPLIMGATMFIQQRLNPTPQDPIQEKMFMLMPIVFTVMLANFPAGLVIYWAWNNLLTIIQQWTIMRREGTLKAKPKAKTK